jgi:hypothetical protein
MIGLRRNYDCYLNVEVSFLQGVELENDVVDLLSIAILLFGDQEVQTDSFRHRFQ